MMCFDRQFEKFLLLYRILELIYSGFVLYLGLRVGASGVFLLGKKYDLILALMRMREVPWTLNY